MKLIALFFFSVFMVTPSQAKDPYSLPIFTQTSAQAWLNSPPLTLKDLKGKVTLIDFWTFDCWNCYRSFPWLHGVQKQYESKGFQIIGIHSPESEHEKATVSVATKVKEFKITNPVMMDNDMGYWKAMNNQFWPAYYLVDKKGLVRTSFIGETHKDTVQANEIEFWVKKLLAE